jgi:uncharacterized surface anchored protein
MKKTNRQHRSFGRVINNIGTGAITMLFLSAVMLMAIPPFPTQAAAGDVYQPPVVNQGGDCINGKIIDRYDMPTGAGWTVDIQGPATDSVIAGPGGVFHLPSEAWLTQNSPAIGYPAGTYTLTLTAPEGWQPFTPITFAVTLNGSHDAKCAQVRFKMEALAHLCVTKLDIGVPRPVGIPGWEITITNILTDKSQTLKTDGLGKACFYNLPPGDYEVLEEDKDGWLPWPPYNLNPVNITLVSPAIPGSITNLTFTNKQVHGAVICVEKRDTDDNLLNGWQIILKRPDGLFSNQTHVTGSDGKGVTCFYNLALGKWEVSETVTPLHSTPPLAAAPWWKGDSNNPQTVTLTVPNETQIITFTNERLGCVDGYKINSLDQGLAGWKITAQKGDEILTDITRATPASYLGYFQFYLPLGTWTISEDVQTGWTPVTPASFEVTVTKPGVCEHVRFKNATKYACVDVYKIDSFDGSGLPGWEVNLAAAYGDGTDTLTGVTDGSGWYRFNGLTPGDYQVWETLQTGWTYVSPAYGIVTPVTLEASGTCKVIVFSNRQTNRPLQTLLDP